MADKLLTKLIKAAGTREDFVKNYNAVMDDVGDQIMTPLTMRACAYWTADGVPPAHSPIWILATVLRMGMTFEKAVAIYPDLQPALELARFVVNLAESKASRAA
jgi:hypothetical protein